GGRAIRSPLRNGRRGPPRTRAARGLCCSAFLMLKTNEPYRYARPKLLREKFAALGGRGPEPGEGTAARTEAKPRTKGKPGLAEVYQAAGAACRHLPGGVAVGGAADAHGARAGRVCGRVVPPGN